MDRILDVLVSPFKLAFDSVDERDFIGIQNLETNLNLRRVMIGVFFSVVIIYFADPNLPIRGMLIKVVAPLTVVAFLSTFAPTDARHSQWLISTISAIAQLAVFHFIAKTFLASNKMIFYNFLVTFTIVHYVALRLLFHPALMSGCAVFLGITIISLNFKNVDIFKVLFTLSICNILGIVTCQRLESMRRDIFISLRNLEKERRKSQTLLERILPKSLISRIIESPENQNLKIYDQLKSSAVMFAQISSDERGADHRGIFKVFDEINNDSGIEKIKTAENIYISMSSKDNEKAEVETLLNAAVKFRQEVASFNLQNDTNFQFRAGIATGPVSSGVIGKRIFAFDVWGPPVNLASRILYQAPWDSICLGESTVRSLPVGYESSLIGEFDLKGAGRQKIFSFLSVNLMKRFKNGMVS